MIPPRLAVLLCALLLVGGCASVDAQAGTLPSDVQVVVDMRDYSIALTPDRVKAGTVKFGIRNNAAMVHQFDLVRTDLAADQLPIDPARAMVDLEATGTLVKQVKGIGGGRVTTVSADLKPGHYVVICDLPGHYQLGMRADLTVE